MCYDIHRFISDTIRRIWMFRKMLNFKILRMNYRRMEGWHRVLEKGRYNKDLFLLMYEMIMLLDIPSFLEMCTVLPPSPLSFSIYPPYQFYAIRNIGSHYFDITNFLKDLCLFLVQRISSIISSSGRSQNIFDSLSFPPCSTCCL